jgi:hypothetical protein
MAKVATGLSGFGVRLGLESESGLEEKTSVSGYEQQSVELDIS